MEKKRVIVTGGGASGLMAAIAAAENGAAVTILEQNEKPGKKICATGNGKCNFTNIQVPSDAYRSENPGFEQAVLNQFPVEDTVKFFTRLGIYPVNKNGGYLYPHSGQAASVAEVLCMEARNLGVKIKTNQKVQRVFKEQDIWKVQVEGWIYEGEAVILANGSKASAISGSDGSGYELAAALGHRLIEPLPALTALKCRNTGFSGWAGVRTEGRITLLVDGEKVTEETGELQLTDYGVSGIPVFQVSRYGIRALKQGKNVVFLTLGDPTIYSTYLYVHKRILERGYQAEIVSGITSFCAVAARLNMGLAEMAEPLHVIPATYKAEEMDELLKLPGTKVLMKSGKRLKKVRDSILRSGQNAVMIENCGMPEEKIYASAKEIPEEAGYYTLLVVKDKK